MRVQGVEESGMQIVTLIRLPLGSPLTRQGDVNGVLRDIADLAHLDPVEHHTGPKVSGGESHVGSAAEPTHVHRNGMWGTWTSTDWQHVIPATKHIPTHKTAINIRISATATWQRTTTHHGTPVHQQLPNDMNVWCALMQTRSYEIQYTTDTAAPHDHDL